MIYDVEISSSAESDLNEIRKWYNNIHPDLGDDFVLSASDTIAHIRNYPTSYALIHTLFRRAIIRRFPYGMFFRIEDTIIKISGVFHSSRSPETWQSRIQ